jgi:hypothetical protein
MVDEFEEGRPAEGAKNLLAESLRKALVTALSAVFMTEEGIRSALSDVRLPKDVIGHLIQQTGNTRRELFRTVSDELKSFLQSADITGAIRKALVGMNLEVRAEIHFVETGAKVTSISTRTVDRSVTPRKARRRRRH